MKSLIVLATVIGVCVARPGAHVVSLQPQYYYAHHPQVPVTYKSQYHTQDELGQFTYGFAHPNQVKHEVRDALGNVAGAYSYIDGDGKQVVVEYTAGKDGFKVKSNNLPVAPKPIEHQPLTKAAVLPIEDTPEVAQAKKEFFEAFALAKAAAESASEHPMTEEVPPVEVVTEVEMATEEEPIEETTELSPVVESEPIVETTEEIVPEPTPTEPVVETKVEPAEPAPEPIPHVLVAPEPVTDTPEVVAARKEFIKLYNEAAIRAAAAPDHDYPYVHVADHSLAYHPNIYSVHPLALHHSLPTKPLLYNYASIPPYYGLNHLPVSYAYNIIAHNDVANHDSSEE